MRHLFSSIAVLLLATFSYAVDAAPHLPFSECPIVGSTRSTTPGALCIHVHLPVEILVTDPAGRRTGTDIVTPPNVCTGAVITVFPATGCAPTSEQVSYREIPSSFYDVNHAGTASEPQGGVRTLVVSTPMAGTYTVDIAGTGDGPYTLDIIGEDVNGDPSRVTLTGKASVGSRARYKVIYSSGPGSQVQVSEESADTTPPVTAATLRSFGQRNRLE